MAKILMSKYVSCLTTDFLQSLQYGLVVLLCYRSYTNKLTSIQSHAILLQIAPTLGTNVEW